MIGSGRALSLCQIGLGEMAISIMKQALRRVEATTREALEAALPAALDKVPPQAALNCFRHYGYSVQ